MRRSDLRSEHERRLRSPRTRRGRVAPHVLGGVGGILIGHANLRRGGGVLHHRLGVAAAILPPVGIPHSDWRHGKAEKNKSPSSGRENLELRIRVQCSVGSMAETGKKGKERKWMGVGPI